MKIQYNKETREWTLVCNSNMEFGRLLDLGLFASVDKGNTPDEWMERKQKDLAATYKELKTAWQKETL